MLAAGNRKAWKLVRVSVYIVIGSGTGVDFVERQQRFCRRGQKIRRRLTCARTWKPVTHEASCEAGISVFGGHLYFRCFWEFSAFCNKWSENASGKGYAWRIQPDFAVTQNSSTRQGGGISGTETALSGPFSLHLPKFLPEREFWRECRNSSKKGASSIRFTHVCVYAHARTVTRRTYLFISLGNIISLSCAREKSAIESIARPIFCKSYMHFSENWGAFSENWGARFGKLGGIFRKTGGHGLKYRRGFFSNCFRSL